MSITKKGRKTADSEASAPLANGRLYQRVAHQLFQDLVKGKYGVGDRLPAERELAIEHDVSRPAVREAMIALEVQGLIDVRVGSGAYVRRLPGIDDRPGFNVTAFELTEARLLFEGESAALAATNITDAELDELEVLVREISDENRRRNVSENADRNFHMSIARATRNLAIVNAIEELWRLRSTSPECALLHAKARAANVRPVVEEHSAIVEALRSRDPAKARAAMRAHLAAVIDHLLFATEEQALAKAREAVASTRRRFGNIASI
jgi:DNA-binding FadR family transcriptional regulator